MKPKIGQFIGPIVDFNDSKAVSLKWLNQIGLVIDRQLDQLV